MSEPLLVVAGAGSGKTETMAARVVWLVANGLVRPEQVLGLTFTRKAAGQLLRRVRTRLARLAGVGLVAGGGAQRPVARRALVVQHEVDVDLDRVLAPPAEGERAHGRAEVVGHREVAAEPPGDVGPVVAVTTLLDQRGQPRLDLVGAREEQLHVAVGGDHGQVRELGARHRHPHHPWCRTGHGADHRAPHPDRRTCRRRRHSLPFRHRQVRSP